MKDERFTFAPLPFQEPPAPQRRKRPPGRLPAVSLCLLVLLLLGCLLAGVLTAKDPAYLDLDHCNVPPCGEFPFGTDPLGRDIFSGIWHGGRLSLCIGFLSAAVSLFIALVYGTLSGMASPLWDGVLMRCAELFISIPALLLVLFLQAILGKANPLSLSLVIGVTGWPAMAKVVRTEVRTLRHSQYVLAAKTMGGGFFHLLFRHFLPNLLGPLLFLAVMSVKNGILFESTLSFLGLGLPPETLSWGSMLSLAQQALLTKSWWAILIPGAFLVILLLCLTNCAHYLRGALEPGGSNLSD